MRLLKIIGMFVLFLIVSAGYFLMLNGHWPQKSDFHTDWTLIREMAAVGEEPLPLRINFLRVARGELPSWGAVAGDFSGSYRLDFPSYQIVYADKTIVIEAPYSKRLFDKFSYGTEYDQKAYETLQQAMLHAALIIPTHEHWDHIGGIAQSPYLDKILPKTLLTKKQVQGPTFAENEFPAHALDGYKPLEYEGYYRAAPGIVLIDAPGHSSGHQLIYVRLQNGREYLFTGDIVWVTANLMKKKARPWLANLKRKENRTKIAHQMKWLYDECYANPKNKLIFIINSDLEQHNQYIKQGFLNDGFEMDPVDASLTR